MRSYREVLARLRAAGCVFAEDEARLLLSAAATCDELAVMVERRTSGTPLEYVVGWAEFYGLRIAVDPGVFVPRRRTGHLVATAVTLARRAARERDATAPIVVVDLCCGSGAVGVALAVALGRQQDSCARLDPTDGALAVDLHAVDIDPVAVGCARRNLATVAGQAYEGDLYGPLPAALRGRVDLLLANAPYVPTGEIGLMPTEARLHEPRVALDGGPEGLDVQQRVAGGASAWLAPGGHLLVETSRRQAAATRDALSGAGLVAEVSSSAELDATLVVAAMPSAPQ